MNKKIALLWMVVVFVIINWSILAKEQHLANGKIVFLELIPVDPRSLMQGDYMALRFSLSDAIYRDLEKVADQKGRRKRAVAQDGFVIVTLDDKKIASYKEFYSDQVLSENDIILRYRVRNGKVKFATNAFFFQEGHGKYYEPALYGQFRVDAKGELLLVAMYDKELKKLSSDEIEK